MPVLFADLVADYEAFLELHQVRQNGFSTGPIPFTEIAAWLDIHGIFDVGQRKLTTERVRVLDRVFLEFTESSDTKKG
jgi:hypothetical protein